MSAKPRCRGSAGYPFIQMSDEVARIYADGQVMEELIRVCPINFVAAAVPVVRMVGDFSRAALKKIRDVELIVLGAERHQPDTGTPMFGQFDTHRQFAEGNIAGLIIGRIDGSAVIIDDTAPDTRFHGKILVRQRAERGRIIINKVAVGPVSYSRIGQARSTIVKSVFQVSDAQLGIRREISLSHCPERCNGQQGYEYG